MGRSVQKSLDGTESGPAPLCLGCFGERRVQYKSESPPGWASFNGRCACLAQSPMCLRRGGDACVLDAIERAGNALYGARVYVELGGRLAHAHATRQSRPDTLSQLIRDRRPAKALTFTLGPP